MKSDFAAKASKRRVSLNINGDFPPKSKALRVNLSETHDTAFVHNFASRERVLWKAENRNAIAAYNQLVEKYGLFSDGLRGF